MVVALKVEHALWSSPRPEARPRPKSPPRLKVIDGEGRWRAPRSFVDPDRPLLRRMIDGDDAAWTEAHRRFRGLIASCVLGVAQRSGVGLDRDDLDDVLAEVFLNMVARDHRRLRQYRPDRGRTVSSWIGLIAVFTARDYLRRSRRRGQGIDTETVLEDLPSTAPSPEATAIDSERAERVCRALTRLPSRDREFVELYFGQALDADAVAHEMGVSVGTVYAKKHKVTAKLKRLAKQRFRAPAAKTASLAGAAHGRAT